LTANVDVTVIDNDLAGIVLSPSNLTLSEGDSDTYTVRLNSQPIAPVTIQITPEIVAPASPLITGNGQVLLNGQPTLTLTFTPTNWNTPQSVTVQVIDDQVDETLDPATTYLVHLRHTASSTGDEIYNSLPPVLLSVTIIENDFATLILTPASLTVAEGGPAVTYTARLATQPLANVTVTITPEIVSAVSPLVTSNGQLLLNGQPTLTLTFTPTNWNTPQTVSVQAIDDSTVETLTGTYALDLRHDLASAGDPVYNGLPDRLLRVTVQENDVADLILTPASLTVAEGGPAATYTARLATQPLANVTVTITPEIVSAVSPLVTSNGQVLLNGQPTLTLTFMPTNWNTPQTVSVQAIDDSTVETLTGTYALDLRHDLASAGDPMYNGLPDRLLRVTVQENDVAN
ncbi:MAG: sodium:calcium exchanger, partial [Chloroflexi bacterium]